MKNLCCSVGILAMSLGTLAQAAPPVAELPKKHLELFETYCFECHDSLMEEGDVDLENLAFNLSKDMKTAETWQKVLNAINSGEMPPDDEPQISASEKTAFLDDLSNQLVTARKVLSDSGGVIAMRRLNRREYHNTIEMLLGVGIDVKSLPEDGGGGSFDTVGASQFMSSDQFEQYLKLGRIAIDEVFDRRATQIQGPPAATSTKTWKQRLEVEEHANKKVSGTYNGYFKGGHDKAKKFLETGTVQKGIVDEQMAKFRIREFEKKGPGYRRYLEHSLTQKGSLLTISPVYDKEFIALPPVHPSGWRKTKHVVDTLPPGDYKFRFRIGALKGTPNSRRFVDLGAVPKEKQFNRIGTYQITGTTDQPQIIEVPVSLSKDGPRKFALREKRDPNGDIARVKAATKATGVGPTPALWIDWVEWEGPLDPPEGESKRIDWWVSADAGLAEPSRARKILEQFSLRAMRGTQPGTDFIDRLLAIFEVRRKTGEAFDLAIRAPLSIILASPGFLYLNEPGGEKERRKLTDRELAVRLAYFLWSAPPDDVLFELAEKKQLSQPGILRQQVDRMIADLRSDEFVSGFVHQWLDMERLDFFQFDAKRHREFDESTRAAARQEVYQSFTQLFRDSKNGRLGKLLKSDYVMINGLLATYYGIDGVTGDAFRKVKLPKNSVRGGLLGMAAIHAMGSDGIESSPVERGAWVLRHLLNDPPPPAPPNVPQLSRLADKPLSARQRVLAHQEEPQCASCHRKIDPIGFGMENFDAAGKWRTTEQHVPKDKKAKKANKGKKTVWEIDPSGKFHNGPAFADFSEMRFLIAKWKEDKFARGFTEHLIEYALGRPFGFTDEDLANGILSSAKSKDHTVSEFFQALVATQEFQSK